jgi:hypothetical protein
MRHSGDEENKMTHKQRTISAAALLEASNKPADGFKATRRDIQTVVTYPAKAKTTLFSKAVQSRFLRTEGSRKTAKATKSPMFKTSKRGTCPLSKAFGSRIRAKTQRRKQRKAAVILGTERIFVSVSVIVPAGSMIQITQKIETPGGEFQIPRSLGVVECQILVHPLKHGKLKMPETGQETKKGTAAN